MPKKKHKSAGINENCSCCTMLNGVVQGILSDDLKKLNSGVKFSPRIVLMNEESNKVQDSYFGCHCPTCHSKVSEEAKGFAKSLGATASVVSDFSESGGQPASLVYMVEQEDEILVLFCFLDVNDGKFTVAESNVIYYSLEDFPSKSSIYRVLPSNQDDLRIIC